MTTESSENGALTFPPMNVSIRRTTTIISMLTNGVSTNLKIRDTRLGETPEKNFLSRPLHFFGYTSTISRFGERFRDGQYSLVRFLLHRVTPPRAQPFVKWGRGGACALCPMELVPLMQSITCCLEVGLLRRGRVRITFKVWLVSGNTHVNILVSVVTERNTQTEASAALGLWVGE